MLKYYAYICRNAKKNTLSKCELGKVADMGIFTRGYYQHPVGYGYGNNLKPEVGVRLRVWANNIQTGKGLGKHYPHPNPAGAMLIRQSHRATCEWAGPISVGHFQLKEVWKSPSNP